MIDRKFLLRIGRCQRVPLQGARPNLSWGQPFPGPGDAMDIFDLDRCLVEDYQRFARSFTTIRAGDIREQVNRIYSTGKFWPDPIVSINPHFQLGDSLSKLVVEGTLDERTERVFRIDGDPLTLFRHQAQAIAKAKQRKSFVVTTGTGSGKSLCFFIPIIDSAIRARAAGENARTRAVVVYPMNALANSQMNELEKFIDQADLPEGLRPTFARYTGQESQDERDLIRHRKPDILLTNFMMLELLMTRQSERDRQVIANAEGLDFIVLDELHTYRGRQGADVAMLIRRLRDRLCRERNPICIGTSATMASEGGSDARAAAVAGVASRLFGTTIASESVIDESLDRATDPTAKVDDSLRRQLTAVDQHALHQLQIRPAPVDGDQGAAAVGHLGRSYGNGMGQSLCVHGDVTLDAGDFLARVVALLLSAVGVLHALRVSNDEAGHGVAPQFLAGRANGFF